MFEKEDFDKYMRDSKDYYDNREPLTERKLYQLWKDAAEFGYNKANEWHHVKDVLPKTICKIAFANAEQRQANGGHIKTDTRSMLKHCATEVVEAMDSYNTYCYTDWQSGSPWDRIEPVNLTAREAMAHFASELADIVCCVLIIAGREGIDIEKAVNGCIEKNRRRAEGTGDKL